MNVELAMMALEGIARSPIEVTGGGSVIEIHASGATFKELARLCLLLGGDGSESGDHFEMSPALRTATGSTTLRLVRR